MPLDERPFPDTTTEVKSENLGWLDGHVVEIDYALADQNTIDEQRAYYTFTNCRSLSLPAMLRLCRALRLRGS
jgi:hypothetical protein